MLSHESAMQCRLLECWQAIPPQGLRTPVSETRLEFFKRLFCAWREFHEQDAGTHIDAKHVTASE